MTKDEIRSAFIDFFLQRGHVLLPNLSLIPDDDTVLLTSAGVQQVQPFFLGMAEPPAPRLVNVQRCLRTVDIETVGDASHLTFFEMMGNWSIGDYFKQQSIQWSWELITALGFPKERLWATVYKGENGVDDDSFAYWREVGLPAERIVYLADKDNWWAPGDTGPCGPDSEIFYDRGEEFGCGRPDCKPGCDCDRFLEFWNNVFTQYNREADGTLTLLQSQNVDTGAGLERWCMLLQGKPSVYETDCFWPLIQAVAAATGQSYGADSRIERSLRIIADHGRALTFLISDGVAPTPEGRGSVLRRLLRRAVLHGRLLGLRRPFLAEIVVPTVVEMMQSGYPELVERASYIAEVADTEERQFLSTIERGIPLAEELVEHSATGGVVDGGAAFDLLQTHGIPLEITREIAEQRGLNIDMGAYDAAEQRHRLASASQDKFFGAARSNRAYGEIAERLGRAPEFLGYETLDATGRVAGIVRNAESVPVALPGDTVEIVLDRTPFYAESGGQVGDQGTITTGDTIVRVMDTQRPKGSSIVVHRGTVESGSLHVGDEVQARVDPQERGGAMAHHSATHLAHRALKDVLGEGVHQEGSVVEPGRFTFDFNLPRAMTADEIARVESRVKELIRADLPVETAIMPYAEAIKTGAMALFAEKYGDTVRVVTMGPSRELCGGTHMRRTGEISDFFILSESSVSAGIRRIECMAGEIAYRYARVGLYERDDLARQLNAQPGRLLAQTMPVLEPSGEAIADVYRVWDTSRRIIELRDANHAPSLETTSRVTALHDRIKTLERQLNEARQEIADLKTRSLTTSDSATATDSARVLRVEHADGFQIVTGLVQATSPDDLKSQSDALKGRFAPCVIVLGAEVNGKGMFTAAATQGLDAKGVRAGDLVKAATIAAGGRGGGSPTWAQGSAPDPSKIDEGLEAARSLLRQRTQ